MARSPKRRPATGLWFVLPYLVFFTLFVFYPAVFAVYLLFHRWDLLTEPEFIGLQNFRELAYDREFWQAIANTLEFLGIHIPLQTALALGLAWILAQPIRGRAFFRAAFFLPVVISGAVVTLLWQKLYSADTGLFNQWLTGLNFPPVPWLTDPRLAMPSIALMATWKNVGFYVILFMAGILSIPPHLYEAARLEGANGWQEFRYITLPLLRPSFLLVAVLSTVGGFNLFVEPYVMTGGGPLGSTLSVVLYMYKHAFSFLHMGYAATIGVCLAMMIAVVTFIHRHWLDRGIEL